MRDPCVLLSRLCVLTLCFGWVCDWATATPPVRRSPDFRSDIIPLLTKHGCNSGSCHGAAIGRGGFKLSLYGGDAVGDHERIVRRVNGRRVNLHQPDQSLLLLKPTGDLSHGGDALFDIDSESATLLAGWIREGALLNESKILTEVSVSPRRHIANLPGENVALTVTARYDDGSEANVTRWTVFDADDETAVSLRDTAHDGQDQVTAIPRRIGRHLVTARYRNAVIPIEIIVPMGEKGPSAAFSSSNHVVDRHVAQTLQTLGLRESPRTEDAALLRRVTLDLTGRLPTPSEVTAFRNEEDDGKFERVVDRLLASDAFTDYWTLNIAKWLRLRPIQGDVASMQAYHRFIQDFVASDGSYQAFVRALLLATGNTKQSGPANFHRTVANAREQTELFSEVLMGVRLRCANCHDHPLDRWTQDDYHGLAAIFATIERGEVVRRNPTGVNLHPRTGRPAPFRIPGTSAELDGVTEPIESLADWLTSTDNPTFSKALVNRLWKQLMGRGLVSPVDDFRATNPPTHPRLLDELASDFSSHGYRLRHTLKRIAMSHTYALSSAGTEGNANDEAFYSRYAAKPLEAEVLFDAFTDTLSYSTSPQENRSQRRAVQRVNPFEPDQDLDILGRCDRRQSCEASAGSGGGLAQSLHLLNDPFLNARLSGPGSRLAALRDRGTPPLEIISAFHLAGLSRPMTEAESDFWRRQLDQADDVRQCLEDFVWAMVNSREFTTNH